MPDIKKCIDDDIQYFGNNENKLKRAKKIIGYGNRYYSPNYVTSTDLAEAAAKDLIANLNIDINTIDLIIFASSMPDYFAPSSAYILHNRLNLPKTCAAFDIPHGCPAYIYAMNIGSTFIESRVCNKVLVIAGDTETEDKRSYNKTVRLLTSGASCATLIEYSEEIIESFYILGSDGNGSESIIIPAGGARIPITNEILDLKLYDSLGQEWQLNKTFMDGIDVFSFTNIVASKLINEILNKSSNSFDDIDFFALHQANKQIVDEIAYLLEIPENKYSSSTFSNYGNHICVSSIGNLVDIYGKKLNTEKIKTVVATYGIGYSWGAMLLDIGNIYCSGIKFINFDNYPSRKEYYNYWKNKLELS